MIAFIVITSFQVGGYGWQSGRAVAMTIARLFTIFAVCKK
jgi:hypothetical protein